MRKPWRCSREGRDTREYHRRSETSFSAKAEATFFPYRLSCEISNHRRAQIRCAFVTTQVNGKAGGMWGRHSCLPSGPSLARSQSRRQECLRHLGNLSSYALSQMSTDANRRWPKIVNRETQFLREIPCFPRDDHELIDSG